MENKKYNFVASIICLIIINLILIAVFLAIFLIYYIIIEKIQLCTTNTVLYRVKRITKIQFMGYKCPSNKHDSLVSSESEV